MKGVTPRRGVIIRIHGFRYVKVTKVIDLDSSNLHIFLMTDKRWKIHNNFVYDLIIRCENLWSRYFC